MFVLDARSYRDRNDVPDTPENDKDMLGKEQIAWLVDGIQRSTATWEIVSSDVPISIGTGSLAFGRDAWANIGVEPTGFERELLRMLAALDSICHPCQGLNPRCRFSQTFDDERAASAGCRPSVSSWRPPGFVE